MCNHAGIFGINMIKSIKKTFVNVLLAGSTLFFVSVALTDNHVTVTSQHKYALTKIAGNLEHPWGLDWLPNGNIIVTERPGRLRIVTFKGNISNKGNISKPINGMPAIVSVFRDGLFDVAVSPNFSRDNTIFFAYSKESNAKRWLQVASAKLNNNSLKNVKVIFEANVKVEKIQGFGSRIRFDQKGNMLISVGDHAVAKNAQKTNNTLGSIIRIDTNGNPVDGNLGGKLHHAIYAYGFKNPQGLTIAPNGDVWAVDHGGAGGDEINKVQIGKNYGWPIRTFGGRNNPGATKNGEYVDPVFTWGVAPTVALSGIEMYSGEDFPHWKGDLFTGSLVQKALIRVMMDGNKIVGTEYVIKGEIGRVREVRQGPDGRLYVLNDMAKGGIYRLDPVK